MAAWLATADRNFEDGFKALLGQKREQAEDVNDKVAAIIARVRAEGDRALVALTLAYDGLDLGKTGIKVSAAEIAAARTQVDERTLAALHLAHDRILDHHKRQRPKDDRYKDRLGVELGTRWTAVASAGLYVPGGTASYPSSVLMNAVPAKVAGVPRIVMAVPALKGALNPLVLVAAELAGVHEIYRVGGAQAIAALAFGTETIPPVAKIVGPGNAYVAAAKRQVYGVVGIDMVAGPSEVVVIADVTTIRPGSRQTCSPRPSTTRPPKPFSSPTIPPSPATSRARSRPSLRSCPARRPRARAGGISAPSSWSSISTRRPPSPTGSRPSISRSRQATPTRSRCASPMPAPSSSAASRRR